MTPFRRFIYIAVLCSGFIANSFAQSAGDVVINEIMYAPTTGNSQEWFEIYNKTGNNYNLRNWKWKDSSGTFRTITTQNITINANSYAVICEDSNAVKTFYTGFSGLIFQTTWNALNNTQDSIVLVDSLNNRIDFVAYRPSWGGSTGNRTLERISPNGPSNISTNWGTSIATIGATPNLRNSVTPFNNDLALNTLSFSNNNPIVGDNIVISANVKNRGLLTANNYSVSFYRDYNMDSNGTAGELITTINSPGPLNSNDSITLNVVNVLVDSAGVRQFIAKVNFTGDEDTTNNKKVGRITAGTVSGFDSLVVNEIMYAPTTGTGKEWFEIYNKTTNPVNLNGWKWKDATSSIITITTQNISIAPGGFVVVCEDSAAVKSFYPTATGIFIQTASWSALNNTGDNVIIMNPSSTIIDSVTFTSSWGGSTGNKSLERIFATGPSNQQSNWGTCFDPLGATPNRTNSVTPKPNDLALNRITFNKSNPRVTDTLGITAQVKNRGLNPAPSYTVSFYEDYNRDSIPQPKELITTLNSTGTLNPNDSVNFIINDILDSTGLRLYIAKVNYAPDNDTNNNKLTAGINVVSANFTSIIVINEIMYDFPTGECEWVELYNNADTTINLKNWKIQDNTATQVVITATDYFLPPDSFVVVSQNSNIFTNHPTLASSRVIINASLPSLNNDGDAIIIYQSSGDITDRVDYRSSWGGDGVSLERISITGTSNDSTNWASSIDCEKSSPGRTNAIANAVHYTYKDLIINEIMMAPLSDTMRSTSEYIELYNPTGNTINLTGWKFYDVSSSKSIADTCSALVRPGMYVVIAADSSIYKSFGYLRTPDTTQKVIILNSSLGLNNDEDLAKVSDIFRTMIDSVHYFDDWHNPNISNTTGVSLERINPSLPSNTSSSWSSCAYPTGGTPGQRNSIFTATLPSNANVTISPNPFSPDNDGFEDFTIINYNLTQPFAQMRIKIFDVKGRLLRTLVNNQTSGSSGSIVFDGLDDGKQKLRLGIYVVFIEALNNQSGVVEQIKTTVVVASKL